MVFLKYFLLSLMFLFSDSIGAINIAIFSLVSLSFMLIVEIEENIYYSFVLSVIFSILMYFFPEFRFFSFVLIYALYKKSIYNVPIFLVFLITGEFDFLALSLLIICLSQYDRDIYERKILYHREFWNFHNENDKLQ